MKKVVVASLLASVMLVSCSSPSELKNSDVPKMPYPTNTSSVEPDKTITPKFEGVEVTSDWETPNVSGYSPNQVNQVLDILKNYSSDAFANQTLLTGAYLETPDALSQALNQYFSPQLQEYISLLDTSSTNSSVVRDVNALATLVNNQGDFVLSSRKPVTLELSNLAAAPEPTIKALKVYFVAKQTIPLKSYDNDDAVITVTHNVSVWMTPVDKKGFVISGHYADWSQTSPAKEN